MSKRNWFVKPETVKIALTDDEWIKIKKGLTVAEERRMQTAGFRNISNKEATDEDAESKGINVDVNWTDNALARARTYLVDWSLTDEEGKSVPLTYDAIKSLAADAFTEINEAIDKHVESMEQEKKAKTGERKPKAI